MKTEDEIWERITDLQDKMQELDKILIQCRKDEMSEMYKGIIKQQIEIGKQLSILFWVVKC